MSTIKKVTVIIICSISFFTNSFSQTIKVKKESAQISGNTGEGYQVEVAGTSAEVKESLQKFMKSYGKVKHNNDVVLLTESRFNGSNPKIPIYGLVKENGSITAAWLGVNEKEWPESEIEVLKNELEKLVYEFGVKFQKDKIQIQIDESNQAYKAVEKQQQKLVNENKSLNSKLTFNEKEKIRLETSLENNKLEHEELLLKIERNKVAQDSVGVAATQIMKVTEGHKKRQEEVK